MASQAVSEPVPPRQPGRPGQNLMGEEGGFGLEEGAGDFAFIGLGVGEIEGSFVMRYVMLVWTLGWLIAAWALGLVR